MDAWPLRHLVLRTPRLELRPADDPGLYELVDVARKGVHDPDEMPFDVPWTDAPSDQLAVTMLQYYWAARAKISPDDWTLHFLIRLDGRVIGLQELGARRFDVLREVGTGSWLGREFQGKGYGTEMRQAVLQFAFDHLKAQSARSGAWTGNHASNRVSAKLGYVFDGTVAVAPRGERMEHTRLRLDAENFVRPEWKLEVDGLAECVHLITR